MPYFHAQSQGDSRSIVTVVSRSSAASDQNVRLPISQTSRSSAASESDQNVMLPISSSSSLSPVRSTFDTYLLAAQTLLCIYFPISLHFAD